MRKTSKLTKIFLSLLGASFILALPLWFLLSFHLDSADSGFVGLLDYLQALFSVLTYITLPILTASTLWFMYKQSKIVEDTEFKEKRFTKYLVLTLLLILLIPLSYLVVYYIVNIKPSFY